MKVLIINGSHRKGNTDIAINKVKTVLTAKSVTVDVLNLRDIEMKLPDGCEICADSGICPNVHDELSEKVEPTLRDYDVYIIATPTWSDSVTPLTKIFWDRLVSWCHEDRLYLKGKKLAVITHGMAGDASWHFVTDWVKGVCTWEKSNYAGALTFQSGGKIGMAEIDDAKVKAFIEEILN